MANYFLNDDGSVSKKKKKKKNEGYNYVIQDNGKIELSSADKQQLEKALKVAETAKTAKAYAPAEEKKWYQELLKMPDAFKNNLDRFDNGYQFGDILGTVGETIWDTGATVAGTAGDIVLGAAKGVAQTGEGIAKLGAGGVAQVADWVGQDEYAKKVRKNLATKEGPVSSFIGKGQDAIDDYSIVGGTGDKVSEALGYIGTIWAGGAGAAGLAGKLGATANKAAKIGNIAQTGAMFGSSTGNALSEAYQKEDVTDAQAWTKAIGTGTIETLTEKLGGVFGTSGFDKAITNKIASKLTSGMAKQLTRVGVQAGTESLEEFLSYGGGQLLDTAIDKVSDGKGAEFKEDWNWDEVGEQMVVAALASGLLGGGANVSSTIDNKTDSNTWTDAINETTRQQDMQDINEDIENLTKKLNKETDTTKKQQIQNQINEKQQQLESLIAPIDNTVQDEISPVENVVQNENLSEITNAQQITSEEIAPNVENVENSVENEQPLVQAASVQDNVISEITPQTDTNVNENVQPSNTVKTVNDNEAKSIIEKTKNNISKSSNSNSIEMVSIDDISSVDSTGGGYRTAEQIEALKQDIRENGITQPLEVIKNEDGSISLNDGNHRLQIAKELGLTEVPVIAYSDGSFTKFSSVKEVSRNETQDKEVVTNKKGLQMGVGDKIRTFNKSEYEITEIFTTDDGVTRAKLKNDKGYETSIGINAIEENLSNSTQTETTPETKVEEALKPVEKAIETLTTKIDDLQKQIAEINPAPASQEVAEQEFKTRLDNLENEEAPIGSGLSTEEMQELETYEEYISENGLDSLAQAEQDRYKYLKQQEELDTTPEEVEPNAMPTDPFENRDIETIGKQRKVNAYQYDNPEVRPYFMEEAQIMLNDLAQRQEGKRFPVIGEDGYVDHWTGQQRVLAEDIAEFKDQYGYSYEQIEEGLRNIIEDKGSENNAVSKKLEFVINDRLLKGYKATDGTIIPPDQRYINLLDEKQTTEFYNQSVNAITDDYIAANEIAPTNETQLAPVVETTETVPDEANTFELTSEQRAKIQELRNEQKEWANKNKDTYSDKTIKNRAMEVSAQIRNITQGDWLIPLEGGLTESELANKIKQLKTNYVGKQVLVDNKQGAIIGSSFGKIGVIFEDGTKGYFAKEKVIPATNIDELIKEQKELYKQYKQQTIAPVEQSNITPTEPQTVQVEENISPVQETEGKMRKWVPTSTESEVVNREILPDDLDQNKIFYQPITNKGTLSKANAKLNSLGYEKAIEHFNSQIANKSVSVEDITLGERLIQEAIKAGDTKTAGELIQNVAILGTELGQKVQALSIIQRMTPEGQLKMLDKVVNRGKIKGDKSFNNVEITQEMKDKILNAYNQDGSYDQNKLNEAVENVKQEIAKQMPVTFMDKVNSWRYFSMLGNPKTHIRNIISNIAMAGTTKVKNAVARTIETIAPIENRTRTWKSASDEVNAFSKQTTLEMKDIISGDNKYSEEADIKSKRDIFKTKLLNTVTEGNSNILEAEDWFFSKYAFNKSFSEFLTANGIKTNEDIQNNPELIEKGKLYATEQAQIATFRQYSWLANKIRDIENKNAATNIMVGSVLPFKKTPINIAKTGLSYSPLGFAKTLTYDIAQVKKGNMEASTLVDHLAQNTTGTALTLIGYMLAQAGLLNGGGDDDKEGKYDYYLGKQAYSLSIGDNTYSLSWLSPVAMPLMVGANAYEKLVEGEEWNPDVVMETLAQTLDPLSEMSFLSSLDSVLSSYDSGVQKFAGIGETMVQNYATQFIPTLSSQLAATLDDKKRSTKVSGDSTFKLGEEVYNRIIYKIPGLRETLEPSTDIWGNEVKQTENMFERAFESFISPYSRKENIATEIDTELKDLYSQTGDDGLIPIIPRNNLSYDGEKYKMSAKEYTSFKKTYGQTANDLLEDLFRTTTYKNATSEEKADMVNDVYDYASDIAKKDYLETKDIDYTNATEDKEEIYRENYIKGAIENDMTPDEYKMYVEKPEKYNFFKDNNISYKDYESNKDIYNYAYEHQDDYAVSKAITNDFATYYSYTKDMGDLDAKDENGESVNGLKKQRVFEYVNSLELNIPQKAIMFKSKYPKDNDYVGNEYNNDIVDYVINSDLTYDEKVKIFTSLKMTVGNDGYIYWD